MYYWSKRYVLSGVGVVSVWGLCGVCVVLVWYAPPQYIRLASNTPPISR